MEAKPQLQTGRSVGSESTGQHRKSASTPRMMAHDGLFFCNEYVRVHPLYAVRLRKKEKRETR